MAKRELITREEAIKTVSRWIKADMTLGSSLFEMMMNEIPTITEQEIVKPILDKIRAEIEDLDRYYDNDYFSGNRDSMVKCNDVLQILDKYKPESEVEE